MGCDVHVCVEVKVNNEWVLINSPKVQRNYEIFEKMAGVRGDLSEAISPPKGIPKDASKGTWLYLKKWLDDAHTHSWFHIAEIEELEKFIESKNYKEFYFEDNFGFLFGSSITGVFKYPKSYPSFIEDVRIVFWFDN